jgi:mannose-6-phosphate isomerase-like protein (cupin superfamily)
VPGATLLSFRVASKTIMKKTTALLAALALGLAAPAFAADAPPTDAVVYDHAKVNDAFAKGIPLLINTSYKVQAGRRVMPGQVEIHASDTDIFYVTEGSATIVTGGKAVDPKTTAVGEVRADKLDGGVPRHLTKGDIIVIPAGVAHQFTEVTGTFLYLVIKVTR